MVRFLLRTLIHRSTWRVGRGRFLSSSTVSSHNRSSKEPLIVSDSVNSSDDSSSASGMKTLRGSVFKLGFAALTSAFVGAVGYTSYAFTSDELEKKAAKFKLAANQTAVDSDVSVFDKIQSLAYSTAAKVPVKAIEIYIDIRKSIEEHIKGFTEPSSDSLLPDLHPQEQHVFTLVLDLNETLVYSDWKRERGWRTFKRPGVEAFLEHLAQFYEIVVYSDQLSMYVDPVIERLDQKGCIRYRLSRAATKYVNGKHYRDLSKLNRDPAHILYLSGHALESNLQPENSVPIAPWKLEPEDTALLDLIPFLEYVARSRPADIRHVLASYGGCNIATEFIKRSKEYQRKTQTQKHERRLLWR